MIGAAPERWNVVMQSLWVWVMASTSVAVGSCVVRAENGAPEEGKPYQLTTVALPAPLHVGKDCQYRLEIAPKAPWVLKPSTPLKVQLSATAGLKVAKPVLSGKDLTPVEGRGQAVASACEAVGTGAQRVDAQISFFLCTDEICRRHEDQIPLAIEVKD